MKRIEDYTDEEKIAKFDMLHSTALNELNESPDEEQDDHYFWEGVIEDILELTQEDWNRYNEGDKL